MIVRATVRLQFHKAFTLADAANLVPYFASLGVTHIYASPLLKARPGSTHGYDIVDHNEINPELGGAPALRQLVAALRYHEMGLIFDIVPNHMGVGGADNSWWLDVLEWGRASPYAEFFDVDWDPPDVTLRGRLLAPFLGASYGDCLEGGELKLQFDDTDGRFFVTYYQHRFPINPHDYPAILLTEGGLLEEPARMLADLPNARNAARRQAAEACALLRQRERQSTIAHVLRAYEAVTAEGRDRLHRLLERQHYRLSWWRAAADEINWRRFFDINGLAGIRVELPNVFDATHDFVLRLYAQGIIDGLRVDHVDGLADPRGYCRKLRRRLDTAAKQRPRDMPDGPAVLWVEKILAPQERLPRDWLTDGTTGYDFMNTVGALLHDPDGEGPLTELWSRLTGRPARFEDEAEPARRQILRESLSSETFGTAAALHRIARRDLKTRDYTLSAIRRVLVEIVVHFHVYRIYAGPGGLSDADARELAWAMAGARRTVRAADRPLLEQIGEWLSGDAVRQVPAGPRRQERLRAMVRFQQLCAPVSAKSVEDTAFYRYGRLLSRNEVGTQPSQFACSVAAFHASNAERRKYFPRALLATATHDHKRGEDTRARIAVLSEIPGEWEAALVRWMRLNTPIRQNIDGEFAPDPADEIMLYQTMVGAWPLALDANDEAGMADFSQRIAAWLEKALREAKRHSEWAAPNEAYETACHDFLYDTLNPSRPVVREIAAFVARIAPAGALNGLTQTVLRLSAPGIPDLYQGTEFWDLSLVDPDNRREIDFAARARALADAPNPASLLASWRNGRVKQAVIARALDLRRRAPGLFEQGAYQKLRVEGPQADHIVAFFRSHEGRAAIVIATRLAARLPGVAPLDGDAVIPMVAPPAWQGTTIVMPRNLIGRRLSDVFGGPGVPAAEARLPVAALLSAFPAALLEA